MKRLRFTEEQIIGVLKEAEAGAKTAELARRHGVSEATIYNWKSKYGGMESSDVRKLKDLEEEKAPLVQVVRPQKLKILFTHMLMPLPNTVKLYQLTHTLENKF